MQLLASVNAGFAACPLGWVELYIRGSSARATWYASFEADGTNSTGANITLDAYGSAEVYVNQLVDVVVKQADGTLFREYTDGYASPNIEVISDSFTGTNYETASEAPGEPTTLQAVLNAWTPSAGGTDWEVYYRGSTHPLTDLAGAIGGLVINVQSAAYGAMGDGVTDDTAAILNALADAVASLHGNVGIAVFFPKGDYRITSEIAWDYRVSVIMVPGSTLAIDHPTSNTLKFTTANTTTYETVFLGLSFKALQTNTGKAISLQSSQNLTLIGCQFGALATGTCISTTTTIAKLSLYRCRFSLNGSTQSALGGTGYIAAFKSEDCDFVTPAAYTGTVINFSSYATDYSFHMARALFDGTTNASVGAFTFLRPGGSANPARVWGSTFRGAGSYGFFSDGGKPCVTGCHFSGLSKAMSFSGVDTCEAYGNSFSSVTTRYEVANTLVAGSYLELDKYETISDTTTPALSKNAEFSEVVSNTTVPTLGFSDGYYAGQLKRLLVKNTSAGNWVGMTTSGSSTSSVSALSVAVNVNVNVLIMSTWIWTDPTAGSFTWLKYEEH